MPPTPTLLQPTVVILACLCALPVSGANKDLFDISLEELMDIEITSVAKKPQKRTESATAIFVLTQDDIRRSGATSIPEALRIVPGVNVARIDANKWAVSIRGFNDRFAGKLLVMIDGRSIYTQQFSGVRWSQQHIMMENIERIEVIRGPGGTVWGANAVNGIINIITKNANMTRGTLVTGSTGSHQSGLSVRHGGKLSDTGNFRIYAKYNDRDSFETSTGDDANDDQDVTQVGGRLDWTGSASDKLTLQFDHYDVKANQSLITTTLSPVPGNIVVSDEVNASGSSLLFNWNSVSGNGDTASLKAWLDQNKRTEAVLVFEETTWDIEFQHRFHFGEKQEITWGANYRRISDRNEGSFTISFDPASLDTDLYSLYVQDEYRANDMLILTLGSKFEHNDFTGMEVQPSMRFLSELNDMQTFWGALSRSVRTPPRIYRDGRINFTAFPGAQPTLLAITGDKDIKSEDVITFELGFRDRILKNLTLDSSVFYNQYDNLVTSEANTPVAETTPAPAHTLITNSYGNKMSGKGYGLELDINWKVTDNSRLFLGYSHMKLDLEIDTDSNDTDGPSKKSGTSPRNQIQLRSSTKLSSILELDAFIYRIAKLPALNIPDYTRVDLRLGWKLDKALEIDLMIKNLTDESHSEFLPADVISSEVPRTIFARAVWKL